MIKEDKINRKSDIGRDANRNTARAKADSLLLLSVGTVDFKSASSGVGFRWRKAPCYQFRVIATLGQIEQWQAAADVSDRALARGSPAERR